jgi:adenylate cyclase, class 2
MALEIEKKYQLTKDETARITAALERSDAVFAGEDVEENIIYISAALKGKQAVLRLRRIGPKTILTYKERLPQKSGIKQQIEHETEVTDFAAAAQIFTALGFAPALVYEKRRRTWQLDDVEVMVDQLPFGLYMEIEGPAEAIMHAEKFLNLENAQVVHETYPQLTAKLGKPNGTVIEARFDN